MRGDIVILGSEQVSADIVDDYGVVEGWYGVAESVLGASTCLLGLLRTAM